MNIVLKKWEEPDTGALIRFAGNPQITQFMSDGFAGVSTPEGAAKFIAFANSGSDKIYRAIEVDGQVVGGNRSFGTDRHSPQKCRIGVLVGRTVLGKRHHNQSHRNGCFRIIRAT